jgi:hypothetical protein
MRLEQHMRNLPVVLRRIVLGLVIVTSAGCADPNNWWNDTFGPKQQPPAQSADATEREGVEIARDPGSEPAPVESDPEPTGDAAGAPDDLEARIREYVQKFPEQHDGAETASSQPDTRLSSDAESESNTITLDATDSLAIAPTETASRAEPPHGATAQPPADASPAPPVLKSVSVATDSEPDPAPADPPAVDPGVNRATRTEGQARDAGIREEITELERHVAEQPNDANAQLRLRMLYLATGQDEKAAAPVAGVSKEMADMLAGLMDVVQASRDAAANPDTRADALLEALDSYREQVKRHADLRVPTVALCTAADSFGVYKPFPPDELVAGKQVVVYCEIENFTSQKTPEGSYRTRLASQVEILDADGRSVATLSRKQFEDLSRNQRDDFFLGEVVDLPTSLAPGEYTLRVMIEDRGSGRFSSGSTRFTILPPAS